MIVKITAVLRDASTPTDGQAPAAPYAQALALPLAEDGTILIKLIRCDRTPVALVGRLLLTVRTRASDYQPVLVREATVLNVDAGEAGFAILAADTIGQSFGRYHYDVFYIDELGLRWQVVPASPLEIKETIGRPGEPTSVPGVEPPEVPADEGMLAMASEGARAVYGQNEELVAQTTFNFSLLETPSVFGILTALTEQTGGATGTYRVRIGGSNNAADGVEVITLNTTNPNIVLPPDMATSAAFARPSGPQLLKLTARSSNPGSTARIRHFNIAFKTVSD
jgi:hypothetical protein